MNASPKIISERLNQHGEELFKRKDYSAALASFLQAAAHDPESFSAFNNLGVVHWHQGRKTEALDYFQNALRLNPSNKFVVMNAADAFAHMGFNDRAHHVLLSYTAKFPNDTEVQKFHREISKKYQHYNTSINKRILENMVSCPEPGTTGEQRLMLVIDFAVQPYNLGDLIIYQAVAEALRELCGVDRTDVCLISDPSILPKDHNIRKIVNPENRFYHLFSIIPVIQTNPNLGSFFLFDSLQSAKKHLANNKAHYFVWPRMDKLDSEDYLFYPAFQLLHGYYKMSGRLPRPFFNDDLLHWYRLFIDKSVGSNLPVTVNLRNNKHFHDHRNSSMDEWLSFFYYCRDRFPVTFIIVCGADEVDPRFRSCSNVVVAKDHQTTLIQDLTLIRFSAFHMGAASGPAALTLFTGKPYLVVNCDMLPHIRLYNGALIKDSDQFLHFSFAEPLQKYAIGRETQAFLIREFADMYAAVSKEQWRRENFFANP